LKKREKNMVKYDCFLIKYWVFGVALSGLGLIGAIFMRLYTIYNFYFDHSMALFIGVIYPCLLQPIGTFCLFVANIISGCKYQKKYLFNPFVLLIVLLLQIVCHIFFLPSMAHSLFSSLVPLIKSPAYQIAVDALFIAYTSIKYIKFKKSTP